MLQDKNQLSSESLRIERDIGHLELDKEHLEKGQAQLEREIADKTCDFHDKRDDLLQKRQEIQVSHFGISVRAIAALETQNSLGATIHRGKRK